MARNTTREPPRNIHLIDRDDTWTCWLNCPKCAHRQKVDRAQYAGEEPVDCVNCPYKQTHNLEEERHVPTSD